MDAPSCSRRWIRVGDGDTAFTSTAESAAALAKRKPQSSSSPRAAGTSSDTSTLVHVLRRHCLLTRRRADTFRASWSHRHADRGCWRRPIRNRAGILQALRAATSSAGSGDDLETVAQVVDVLGTGFQDSRQHIVFGRRFFSGSPRLCGRTGGHRPRIGHGCHHCASSPPAPRWRRDCPVVGQTLDQHHRWAQPASYMMACQSAPADYSSPAAHPGRSMFSLNNLLRLLNHVVGVGLPAGSPPDTRRHLDHSAPQPGEHLATAGVDSEAPRGDGRSIAVLHLFCCSLFSQTSLRRGCGRHDSRRADAKTKFRPETGAFATALRHWKVTCRRTTVRMKRGGKHRTLAHRDDVRRANQHLHRHRLAQPWRMNTARTGSS